MSTAAELISRVGVTLFDESGVRWGEPELLQHLTDAQRQVTLLKPEAYTKNESVQLVAGSLQSLPTDGVLLVDVLNNMGSDGATAGGAVTQIDRTILESSRPNWRADSANINARHFVYDDRDQTHFEVYPPQPTPAGFVQISYCAEPPEITSTADELVLSAIYDIPIYYFTLARCYAKSTGTQDFNKAAMYQQLATSLVLGRKASKQSIHPEQIAERVKR